jgi:hypothetical protein
MRALNDFRRGSAARGDGGIASIRGIFGISILGGGGGGGGGGRMLGGGDVRSWAPPEALPVRQIAIDSRQIAAIFLIATISI